MIPGPVVIRCLGLVGSAVVKCDASPVGEYLAAFDADAYDGHGEATFTRQLERAKVFPNLAAAWKFVGTRPKKKPSRADGKPNRPLTAFTLQILPRETAAG